MTKRVLLGIIFAVLIAAGVTWFYCVSSAPPLPFESQTAPLAALTVSEAVKSESATVLSTKLQYPMVPAAPERPYSPPLVRDARLQALVNRDARDRVPSDISARLPQAISEPARPAEDFPALLQVLTDAKDDDTPRNEVANLLRRSHCPNLSQAFINVLDNPAEHARFRFFAMQHLGNIAAELGTEDPTRAPLITKIQSALTDKNFEVRSQALQHLTQQCIAHSAQCIINSNSEQQFTVHSAQFTVNGNSNGNSNGNNNAQFIAAITAVKWLTDYPLAPIVEQVPQAATLDKNVTSDHSGTSRGPEFERGTIIKQCIECVAKLGLKEQIPTVRKYVSDSNASIAEAAIIALTHWGDTESLPAMIEAAKSKDPLLRKCAKDNIEKLKQKQAAATEPAPVK